jgi:carbamoyl-phosphate synthase small subunit
MNLYLEDGSVYEGRDFGARQIARGEVVFTTGMTGYVETLTDPSYAGQILVCTYPLLGNYGVPTPETFESPNIQIAGLVVSEYSEKFSHRDAIESLSSWLRRNNIPAISGIDTRAITKKLRDRGVMLGKISAKNGADFYDPNRDNLVAQVSPHTKRVYGSGKKVILAVDCGMKENIVRSLVRSETTIIRVPWNYDVSKEQFDALFISNGPGDPTRCIETIDIIRSAMTRKVPILGICLGNQLLALASGAKTYKLPYGHRGQNQPVLNCDTKRAYITSQNHGFAVETSSLDKNWHEWFSNVNDHSNEGIRHSRMNWRSVQFHPEASPGPTDTSWIFDEFISSI